MIIALMGDAGAGKDTVADYLVSRYGFRKHAFAARLYREIADTFGVSVDFLADRTTKDSPQIKLSLSNCRDIAFVTFMQSLGFTQNEPLSPRVAMQRWGDYRRESDPDYFITQVMADIRGNRWFNHVISDVRKLREYHTLGQWHASYWRISRPGYTKAASHSTETELAHARVDVRLPNTGTIFHLHDMVDAMLVTDEALTA